MVSIRVMSVKLQETGGNNPRGLVRSGHEQQMSHKNIKLPILYLSRIETMIPLVRYTKAPVLSFQPPTLAIHAIVPAQVYAGVPKHTILYSPMLPIKYG